MPIDTQCQGCGKRLRVADEYAGRRARCPQCGYVYSVPTADESRAASPEQSSAEPASDASSFSASAGDSQTPLPQSSAGVDHWYMKTPEGQIYGPVARATLTEWVGEGRITEDCQIRRGEHGEWTDASRIFTQLATANPLRQSSSGGTYASGYRAASHASFSSSHRHVRPHRGTLILVLAILGWTFCPIFSVMAWAMGAGDLNQMQTGLMDDSGRGATQAGQILGMIHTILSLLGIGLVLLMILCGIAAEGM